MYLRSSQIRNVHLEITSKCNLLCPACARVEGKALNPRLPLGELEWSPGVDRFFSAAFCQQLDFLYMCGNYGDAAAASGLPDLVSRLLERGLKLVSVCSNGSLRSPEWWSELGRQLKGRGQIIFSVDGIGATNAIYRIGSSWEKILANMEAAARTGVFLRWDFIVFRHNQHQIDEVRELARRLGFHQLNFRTPSRLALSQSIGYEAPTDPRFVPTNLAQLEGIQKKFGSFEQYVRQTKIHCKTQLDSQSIYLDFRGELWPCCWVGGPRYFGPNDRQRRDLERAISAYAPGFNNLENFTLEEILAHEFFAKDLEASWRDPEKRLFTCGRTCGENFEFTCLPGYANSHLENLRPADGELHLPSATIDG